MSKERISEARKLIRITKYGSYPAIALGGFSILLGMYLLGFSGGAVPWSEPWRIELGRIIAYLAMVIGSLSICDGAYDLYLAMKIDVILKEVEKKLGYQ